MDIEQLSDFEPKGATCRAFGVLHPAGFAQRALVLCGPDATVRWSYEAPSPGDLPGVNLLFDALEPDSPDRARLRPAAPRRPGRPCPGARRRAGRGGLRGLRVPVLRRAGGAAAGDAAARRVPPLPAPQRASARLRGRVRGRGRRSSGCLLAHARRALRRPGPARGPAPVGAGGAARPRRRALRRRPPLGAGDRPRRGGLPRRPARRRADDADALRGRRAPRGPPGRRAVGAARRSVAGERGSGV